jgi:A118 family predicted phage portal protein
VYLRVTWDPEVEPEHPLLTSVDVDCAVPEFMWGRLIAVTFWRVIKNIQDDDKAVFRHLERHEPGFVLHGLYRGNETHLGERMPLSLMGPDWVTDDQESDMEVVETGIRDLTAVYIPNMRPNRLWRGSQMGRSDYDGVEALMDSLDETWTSWMRDLRLGRARLMVPQEYMDKQGPGKASIFDLDQEVFEALPMAISRDENAITPSQFLIRAQEHMTTATALMDRIVAASGYSAATFGLEEVQRGVTATEIISREKRTIVTRDKKISYWKGMLAKILNVYLQIDAVHFQMHEVFTPRIDWPDAVQEDPGKMSATVVTLRQAMAASTETLVKMVHPAWTQEEVDAEVVKIMEEKMMVPVKPGGPVATPPAQVMGEVRSPRGGQQGNIQGAVPENRSGGVDSLLPGSTQGGPE